MAWPGSTDTAAHQSSVNHFQLSSFWMEEQVFQLSHWKCNPVCSTFLGSLEICGLKDFHVMFTTTHVCIHINPIKTTKREAILYTQRTCLVKKCPD